MISFLIKSGLCLAILLAFYYLVLEREKMHHFNRFYLLGSILFSFVVPFTVIYVEVAPTIVEETTSWIAQKSQPVITESSPVEASLGWSHYLFIGYTFVSLLMLIRFVKSLIDIILKIKQNEVISYQKAKIVLVNDAILPHTFWNYIFINKEEFQQDKIEKELFTHELTHVTQKHTLDVVLVEALQVVLWFNPFFYPLKKAIQLNHEFLADDKVIASHNDIPKYQYLLLDKAAWKNKYYLASNLNYSLTKKRLLMMKTPNSRSMMLWKKLAIVPLMGGLIFLFADRVEAQSKKKKPEVIEIQKQEKKATKAQMDRYKKLIKSAEKTNIYKQRDVQAMKKIYSQMSAKQKKSVTNISDILPPPPPRPVKIEVIEKKKLPPPPPPRKNKSKKDQEAYEKALKEYEENVQKIAKIKELRKEREQKKVQKIKELEEKYQKLRKLNEVRKKEVQEKKAKVQKKKLEEEYKRFVETVKVKQKQKLKEKKAKKKKKGDWETIEEQIGNPKKNVKVIEVIEEEREVPTVREVKEVEEIIEEVEVVEILEKLPQEEEVEVVEQLITISESEIKEQEQEVEEEELELKQLYKDLVKKKAVFYLNGKKTSARKVKKYFHEKHDKLKNIDITKGKTEIVKVTTLKAK